MEVEDASGQRRFEFRESIDREAGVPAGTAELYDVHEKRSPNWTLSSLSRVLAIAEAVNFKVAGISQLIYQGKRGAIQLHVPGQEEIGRGEITAHRHEGQTVYCLRIEVGPQRVSGAEM